MQYDSLLSYATSERKIISRYFLGVAGGELADSTFRELSDKSCVTEGKLELRDDFARVNFLKKNNNSVYQLKVNLGEEWRGNGFTICFKISNWKSIAYLAVGDTQGGVFRHVKVTNPIDNDWVTFTIGVNDLAFRMQNNWQAQETAVFRDLRIFIKGEPTDTAFLDFSWLAVWEENEDHTSKTLPPEKYCYHDRLLESLVTYFNKCNPNIHEHAQIFLDEGRLPLTGSTVLEWSLNDATPAALGESGTFRYLWHAMHPAVSLLVYYIQTSEVRALMAGTQLVADWLERSFFTPDSDNKYTWYDHGAAERLLALILILCLGKTHRFDKRFMTRVSVACIEHAVLLESEVFYAAHQKTRYHNHAWFQDMALIAAAILFESYPCAERWLATGIKRLTDQFDKLIVRDNGYAVFVENSIGYHHGIQRLVEFAGELVTIAGIKTEMPNIALELNAWSKYFRYPDGRIPAQGDTFRIPNGAKRKNRPFEEGIVVLPSAGYAVAKNYCKSGPYMLAMFATSLCSTHKHQDNLSIVFHLDGVEWLVDPSMYSHDYNSKIPAFLRSAQAHNCLAIQDIEYSIEPGMAALEGRELDNGFVFEGYHRSYAGGEVTRVVKGTDRNFSITVTDKANFEKSVTPYIVWHFGEGVVVEKIGGVLYLSHPNSRCSLRLVTTAKVEIVSSGQEKEGLIAVAGSSFMTANATALAYIKLTPDVEHSVTWSLEVLESYADDSPINEKNAVRVFSNEPATPIQLDSDNVVILNTLRDPMLDEYFNNIEKKRLAEIVKYCSSDDFFKLALRDSIAGKFRVPGFRNDFAAPDYSIFLGGQNNYIAFGDEETFFISQRSRVFRSVYFPGRNVVLNVGGVRAEEFTALKAELLRVSYDCMQCSESGSPKFAGLLVSHCRPYHYFYDLLPFVDEFFEEHPSLIADTKFLQVEGSFVDMEKLYPDCLSVENCSATDLNLNSYKKRSYSILPGFGVRKRNKNSLPELAAVDDKLRALALREHGDEVNELNDKYCFWIGFANEKRRWLEQSAAMIEVVSYLARNINSDIVVIVDGLTSSVVGGGDFIGSEKGEHTDLQDFKKLVDKYALHNVNVVDLAGASALKKIAYAQFANFFITDFLTDSIWCARFAKLPGIGFGSSLAKSALDKYSDHVHPRTTFLPPQMIVDIVNKLTNNWARQSVSISADSFLEYFQKWWRFPMGDADK